MKPRDFLVRGLLVGLLAGIAAFLVAHQVGEPQVEAAIALEEAAAPAAAPESETHTHEDGATHTHDAEGAVVSRATQRTWGLGTGTLVVGVALGGIMALVSAAAVGRIGRLGAAQSTALVVGVGFVAYALVPFLKYPATPPAVGDGETIGARTGLYFGFVLLSLVVAVVAVVLAARLWRRVGALPAVGGAVIGYVLVVGVAAALFPVVDELGSFPASTLWSFRLSSLLTLAALWGVLALGLSWAVQRLAATAQADAARRSLAASL